MLHIDTRRLGRIQGIGHRITGQRLRRSPGIGRGAVHLTIDDHSRVSLVRLLSGEKAINGVRFLRQAMDGCAD